MYSCLLSVIPCNSGVYQLSNNDWMRYLEAVPDPMAIWVGQGWPSYKFAVVDHRLLVSVLFKEAMGGARTA